MNCFIILIVMFLIFCFLLALCLCLASKNWRDGERDYELEEFDKSEGDDSSKV